MTTEKHTQHLDVELNQLENRVNELIHVCDCLTDENESLRKHRKTLSAERKNLMEKNDQARSRVESMITRLRSMERHP